MRRIAIPLAALLLAATASAFASGLPKVGSIQIGPHQVDVYNDSPSLVIGSNTVTVEIASLPADSRVSLSLNGPQGQAIEVPLRPVLMVGDQDARGGHDAEPSSGHDAVPNTGPVDAHAGGHDAKAGDGHGAKAASYRMFGTIRVPSPGTWVARFAIHDRRGTTLAGEVPLEAIDGGPSTVFLGAASSLMAGAVVIGAIQRRRQSVRRLSERGKTP